MALYGSLLRRPYFLLLSGYHAIDNMIFFFVVTQEFFLPLDWLWPMLCMNLKNPAPAYTTEVQT